MNKVLAVIFATAFFVVSVPAFACGGDKSAKKDDTVVTAEADGETVDGTQSKKKAKKEKAKKDGEV